MNASNALSSQLSMVSLATLMPPFFHCSLTISSASGEGVSWLNRHVAPCWHLPLPNKNLHGCSLPSCEYLRAVRHDNINNFALHRLRSVVCRGVLTCSCAHFCTCRQSEIRTCDGMNKAIREGLVCLHVLLLGHNSVVTVRTIRALAASEGR